MTGELGVWTDATAGYDPDYDWLLSTTGGDAYPGVYHQNGVDGWDGSTGFYRRDGRAALADDEDETWLIHFWADRSYTEPEMFVALAPLSWALPPKGRDYSLELLYVPEGVSGAPAVGTVWPVPIVEGEQLQVVLPTYASDDGLTGYQLAFSVSAVPDPCDGMVRGDANCDGTLSFLDIGAFVAAVEGEEEWLAYLETTPTCDYLCVNDINGDGSVSFLDIGPFVDCLDAGGCP